MDKNRMHQIHFMAAVEAGDYLYFSAWLINGLFRMDSHTKEITYIGRIKQETREKCLHRFAFLYENRIYFIPAWGRFIAKLNLSDLSIETISIPEDGHFCQTEKFANIIFIQDELWMIPSGYDALLKLNFKTEKLEKYGNWPEQIKWKNKDSLLFCQGIHVLNCICMCPNESSYFVTFDLETKEMKKWDWSYPKYAFCSMIYHKDNIWFLPRKDYPYIVKYSLETQEKYLIPINEIVERHVDALFYSATIIDDIIILPPYQSKHWLIVDTVANSINKMEFKKRQDNKSFEYPLYQAVSYFRDGFIATSDCDEVGQFVSKENYQITEFAFVMSDENKSSYLAEVIEEGGFRKGLSKEKMLLLQEDNINIELYINAISKLKKVDENNEAEIDGEKIYRYLRS